MALRKLLLTVAVCAPFQAQAADQQPPSPLDNLVQNFLAERQAMEGSEAALVRSSQHLDEIAKALVTQYASERIKWEQERQGYEARLQTAMEWLKAAQAEKASAAK